jgi:lauroyl/myristoyl acyltransferase
MMPLLRTLRKENGIVGLAIDRNLTSGGVWLPFLGEEALLVDGAVRLALRAKAPLLFGYCRRLSEDDSQFEVFIQPPVELPDPERDFDGDFEAAVREGMKRLFSRLERVIWETPDQWLLTAPMWATERQVRA